MKLSHLTFAAAMLMVAAAPLTAFAGAKLFKTADDAAQACGADEVVWVVLDHHKYYHAGAAKFGKGEGLFTCGSQAKSEYIESKADGEIVTGKRD